LEGLEPRLVKVLIAIPVFNEEASIARVLRSLPASLSGVDQIERLVVDDGSSDRTAELARNEGALVVVHPRNHGVGRAFQTAVEQALLRGADIMVTIDGDGQFDPEQIPELLKPIVDDRADVVTGCRFRGAVRPDGMPWVKYQGNLWMARLIRSLSGVDLSDASCGFRAYGREALMHLNLFGGFTYTQETILDMAFKGARIAEVPVHVRYFEGRESRVAGSIPRYALNTAKIILRTVRDFKPFRFFGGLGLGVFAIGALFDLWLLRHYLLTGGFTPYKIIGVAGGGLNLIGLALGGLGLLADMLERIRLNQERLLYYHKKAAYDPGRSRDEPGLIITR